MLPHSLFMQKRAENPLRQLIFMLLLVFSFSVFTTGCLTPQNLQGAEQETSVTDSTTDLPETYTKAQLESILAGLSDEQVRKLLINELKNDAVIEEKQSGSHNETGPAAFLNTILQTLNSKTEDSENQMGKLWTSIPNVFPDLLKVFITLCPYGSAKIAVVNVLWVLLFVGVGLVLEMVCKKLIIKKYFTLNLQSLPIMTNTEKLFAGFAREFPDILGLFLFFGSAYFSFLIFTGTNSHYVQYNGINAPSVQLFFLAILVALSLIRTISIISHILFSPSVRSFRILPLNCQTAQVNHRLLTVTAAYIISALMFTIVTKRLGAEFETFLLLQLFFATLLLLITAFCIVIYKNRIKTHILSGSESDTHSWGKEQFANIWHLLALLYLFVLWILLLNDISDPDSRNKGAFILSFFVVPIWMIADRIMQWIVAYFMSTLNIHQQKYDSSEVISDEELEQREKGKLLYFKMKGLARIVVVIALLIWVASLWNIRIPFISNLAGAMLDTLIILTVTLFFWQFISSWIERKIQESLPEEEEEEDDSEWGGAASRGRSYTLLPMIRKFIGTCLIVVVTMTVLSSMGVDIGPLLAGAGVIGLAIGFGAQKLVSDIFSGFFYLLDDAFRVGEYLKAGTVSGTVESISLRNVMLRHHRGMLQIVPHSELGAITNFMRGGIIVKFNLDFPYDSDIDKIRKIIKKVGIAMLDHEEYGKDFIRPVKSQGVREITNSVMTIRVKFTAQPGTHFVIRREAYRLVTEALNAKGIEYAHKKVIVDLPQPEAQDQATDSAKQQQLLAQAAGAAAQRVIEQEEAAAATATKKDTNSGMPGM